MADNKEAPESTQKRLNVEEIESCLYKFERIVKRFKNIRSNNSRDELLKYIQEDPYFMRIVDQVLKLTDSYKKELIDDIKILKEDRLKAVLKEDEDSMKRLSSDDQNQFIAYHRLTSYCQDMIDDLYGYCNCDI